MKDERAESWRRDEGTGTIFNKIVFDYTACSSNNISWPYVTMLSIVCPVSSSSLCGLWVMVVCLSWLVAQGPSHHTPQNPTNPLRSGNQGCLLIWLLWLPFPWPCRWEEWWTAHWLWPFLQTVQHLCESGLLPTRPHCTGPVNIWCLLWTAWSDAFVVINRQIGPNRKNNLDLLSLKCSLPQHYRVIWISTWFNIIFVWWYNFIYFIYGAKKTSCFTYCCSD